MFLPPSEWLIFFHIFIPLGSIRNTYITIITTYNDTPSLILPMSIKNKQFAVFNIFYGDRSQQR